jgi:hypothetical protein
MRDGSNSKRRYYQNKRKLNNIQPNTNDFEPINVNNLTNLKTLQNDRKERPVMNLNQNKSQIFKKLNIKNAPKCITEYENDRWDKNENKVPPSQNTYVHRKNCYSKDLTYSTKSPFSSSGYNKSNTSQKKFHKINPKQNIYKNSFRNNDNSHDYVISNYRNIYNNPNSKYNTSSFRINSNKSYEIQNDKFMPNTYREGKRIPVIVVSKKHFNTSTYNSLQKRRCIIKIQSAWRGYFLRKIAVGSIKKYIGFIALIKYLDKIYINNFQYFFEEFISIMKNFDCNKQFKYIYKKINYNDNKYNNIKLKNFGRIKQINQDDNNEIGGYRSNRHTMFKSLDCDYDRDKSENNIHYKRIKQNLSMKKNLGPASSIDNNGKRRNIKINLCKKKISQKYNKNSRNKRYFEKTDNSQASEDFFNKSIKNVYVPKKIGYKSFIGKNNQAYKKLKLEKIINIIKNRCYHLYYPIALYKLKILEQLYLLKLKLNLLYLVIKLVENKRIKKIFKKYRNQAIALKVKQDFFKESQKKVNKSSSNGVKQNLMNKKYNKNNGNRINYNINNNNNLKRRMNENKINSNIFSKEYKYPNKNKIKVNNSDINFIRNNKYNNNFKYNNFSKNINNLKKNSYNNINLNKKNIINNNGKVIQSNFNLDIEPPNNKELEEKIYNYMNRDKILTQNNKTKTDKNNDNKLKDNEEKEKEEKFENKEEGKKEEEKKDDEKEKEIKNETEEMNETGNFEKEEEKKNNADNIDNIKNEENEKKDEDKQYLEENKKDEKEQNIINGENNINKTEKEKEKEEIIKDEHKEIGEINEKEENKLLEEEKENKEQDKNNEIKEKEKEGINDNKEEEEVKSVKENDDPESKKEKDEITENKSNENKDDLNEKEKEKDIQKEENIPTDNIEVKNEDDNKKENGENKIDNENNEKEDEEKEKIKDMEKENGLEKEIENKPKEEKPVDDDKNLEGQILNEEKEKGEDNKNGEDKEYDKEKEQIEKNEEMSKEERKEEKEEKEEKDE